MFEYITTHVICSRRASLLSSRLVSHVVIHRDPIVISIQFFLEGLWFARPPLAGHTPAEGMTHLLFRCLRDVLLCTELLIPFMCRFSTDIGDVSFLVFEDVEPFALNGGVLQFVARKRGVELLLFCRLRSTRVEASLGEQRRGVLGLHAGAAGNEHDAAGGQY